MGDRRGRVLLATRVRSPAMKPGMYRLGCAQLVSLLSPDPLRGALVIVLNAAGLSVPSPNRLPVR